MDLKKVVVVLVALMLAVMVAGCGSVSEKVGEKAAEKMIEKGTGGKVDIKGDDVTIKTKEGDTEVSIGSKKLPDGFPKNFPLYKGAELQGSMSTKENGKTSMIVTLTSKDDYAKVVEFYNGKDKLGDYEVSSTLDLNEAFTLGLKKGDEDVGSVMIAKDEENTSLIITLNAK
ncbi:MAG: hypothetical protein Q8J63_02870 [Candidatus Aquicultor sp.]|nr:hypothetical protein [Candidatus Aquicultor sp.]